MPYFLSPFGNTSAIDANGNPVVGGSWRTFRAGTSTAETTYTSQTGAVQQGTTMTLNALGLPVNGPVWMLNAQALKFRLFDALGVFVSEWDNVSGIGDINATPDEWVLFAAAPTYLSPTTFTVAGDQTNTFQAKRKLKSTNSGGTVYSTIFSSVFAASATTVTVTNLVGALDAGLSAVSYGLLAANNSSIPDLFSPQAFTTAGTSTAYTLTPTPAITAYATGQSFFVNFALASGASPTLQISGVVTPPQLVRENADGTYSNLAVNEIPINHRSRVTLISATQALVERFAASISGIQSGAAPIFGARAWVNFNGTGTVAINASGNVSSITDNGVGDYTVNFTTALPNVNFAVNVTAIGVARIGAEAATGRTTSAARVTTQDSSTGAAADVSSINVIVMG